MPIYYYYHYHYHYYYYYYYYQRVLRALGHAHSEAARHAAEGGVVVGEE
jgi:hypothetical protein